MQNDAAFLPMQDNQQRNRPGTKQTMTSTVKLQKTDDDVAFRIVCPVSVVGGLFGGSGSVVSAICQDTECKIHCEEHVPGSDHLVILVVGSGSVDRRIVFYENNVREECGNVSSTQEAVIRVFERMWEVEAEIEGEGDDVAYCGLLTNTTQIGAVVGKGGKNVTTMRRKTGAKIRMLPPPVCASKADELIQITGATLAVKKALVAVTACLQDFSAIHPVQLKRPVEKVQNIDFPNLHTENFPDLLLQQPLTGNSVNCTSTLPDADGDPSIEMKGRKETFELRMLFSDRAAAGIIGKRGEVVKSLENVFGASIIFAAPLTKCGERVVTISALENLEIRYSPVQNAAIHVFARSVKVEGQQEFSSGVSKGATVSARLLVGADFVGCLTRYGDGVVSEMTDVFDTDIQLSGGQQVLDCASENDVVVQITGRYKNVQNALFQVIERLRHILLSSDVFHEVKLGSSRGRTVGTTPPAEVDISSASEQKTIMQGVDQFRLPLVTSQKLKTELRKPATPTTDGNSCSRNFRESLELEKSLVHLLPTKVVDEVRVRRTSRSTGETTSSVMKQPSSQTLDSGPENILMERWPQLDLSDSVGGPLVSQPLKTQGRGYMSAATDGGKGSKTSVGHKTQEPPLTGNSVNCTSASADADRDPSIEMKGRKENFELRMLFSDRVAAGIIGKRGASVKSLENVSGASIIFAAPLTKSGERVVTISALENLEIHYSPVQNAAIHVFARSVMIEGQQEFSSGVCKGATVSARLLVGADHVGCLTRYGGGIVSEMTDEFDADIQLSGGEQVFDCAAENDVVVQITGEYKNVQNALSQVIGRLKHILLSSDVFNEVKLRSSSGLTMRTTSPAGVDISSTSEQETIMQGVDQFRHPLAISQNLQPSLTGNFVNCTSASIDADGDPSIEMKGRKEKFELRMLFSDRVAAGIIGKRGASVKSLENVSGASIIFAAPLTKSGERVVTISALENLEIHYSPVQKAAILVFDRSAKVEGQQEFSSGVSKGAAVSARLLVGSDFVGCLTRYGGGIVSGMADVCDSVIQLSRGEQVLDCAAENDVVVQITGEYKNVRNALFQVIGRLRNMLLSSDVFNEVNLRSSSGRTVGKFHLDMI